MQFHILVLFSRYASLISSSEKSFSSLFSMTPSLCRLREAPSHLSCDTAFPVSRCQTLALLPPTKKIEGFARDDVAETAFSKHIRCTLREINPFSHTVISSAARNLPCTLLFLAPFAKVFPFSAVTHTTLYRCARKIPRLRSG